MLSSVPRPEPEPADQSMWHGHPHVRSRSLDRPEASLILLRHKMVQQRTDSLEQAVTSQNNLVKLVSFSHQKQQELVGRITDTDRLTCVPHLDSDWLLPSWRMIDELVMKQWQANRRMVIIMTFFKLCLNFNLKKHRNKTNSLKSRERV